MCVVPLVCVVHCHVATTAHTFRACTWPSWCGVTCASVRSSSAERLFCLGARLWLQSLEEEKRRRQEAESSLDKLRKVVTSKLGTLEEAIPGGLPPRTVPPSARSGACERSPLI